MKPSGPRRPQSRRPKEPRTKFAVDAMHGSLARKLRALGFDAAYYKEGEDEGLIETAAEEGRIILSSDRSLVSAAASRDLLAILLKGKSDSSRLREISEGATRLGVGLRRGDSLCSLCGKELQILPRARVAGLVPPSVENSHRLFYRCTSCGQLYWHGGHWKRLRSLARQLDEK